jgi:2-methylisocitrate lyase-like PEP mutase family enzyme
VSSPPTQLTSLLTEAQRSRRPLVVPGAYDAFSARLIARVGFSAVYVTGAGLANSHLGVPDIGLVDLSQLVEQVSAIADVVEVPLIVDADTGFGNAVSVTRTVRRLERAGAAALQLEDQVAPKRCGHFAGKAVISVGEMVGKLHAALDSRSNADVLIIARTDARSTEGLAGAIERAGTYREAGADLIFVEAPESEAELAAIADAVDAPLVANMVEGGVTPLLEREELGRLGFAVALYANSALRAAQRNVTEVLSQLYEQGSTSSALDLIATWSERQDAVGKAQFDRLEEKYS